MQIRSECLEYSQSNLVCGRVFHFGIYGNHVSYGAIVESKKKRKGLFFT
jgi:hypothetical protein